MILNDNDAAEGRRELAEVVRALAEKTSPRSEAVLRADRIGSGGFDDKLWGRLVDEVGVLGLATGEQDGGAGATVAEVALISEILGGRTDAVPFLGSLASVEVMNRVSGGIRDELLPALIDGQIRACVAHGVELEVGGPPEAPILTGLVDRVLDASGADILLLGTLPTAERDAEWFEVRLEAAQVNRLRTLDLVRDVSSVTLDSVPGRRLEVGAAGELDQHLSAWLHLLVAAEQLGVAEQALADAVDYAQLREQFGRVIGSFQGLKHLLADVAAEVDLGRSLLEHAVWAGVEEPSSLPYAAAMALLATSKAATFASAENVHAHGGIGFSWEHPAHLLFRKARSNEVLFGQRSELVDQVLKANGVAA